MTLHVSREPHAVSSDASQARLTDPRRLEALWGSGLLHGAANPVLDGVARVAAVALGAPIAFVALVDDRRQYLPGLAAAYDWAGEARGTPLTQAYAQHVVTSDTVVLISDVAADSETRGHPALELLGAHAFAGMPLRVGTGEVLGALCVAHTTPVRWGGAQVGLLEDLAAAATAEIERLLTVQALAQAETRWQEQAERDALTGLLNRRGFSEQARHHLALAQRTAAPFSIAVVDIDHLRAINEVFGHDVGDQAVIEMAELLRTVSRETDLIARLDGDQFALLLCNTNREEAESFQRRFQEALAARPATAGRDYRLHACLGAASWTLEAPHTLATLLRVAEESLHIEKGHRDEQMAATADRLSPGGGPD